MSKLKPFVWNDETVKNTYNFRVRNSGGRFARFDTNPVMLNSHVNTPEMTIGNWKGRRVEGVQLIGDANFDLGKDNAKEIARQVNEEFIKGCSMGIAFTFDEESWELMPDGTWELVIWELLEVTICAVPSNAGALALYDSTTREPIAEEQLKLGLINLSAGKNLTNPNIQKNMTQITLSTDANSVMVGQGFSNLAAITATEISTALVNLQAALKASTTKAEGLQTKLDDQVKLQAEALVDGAIGQQKLTAGERQEWIDFATVNYKLAAGQIAKMKGVTQLSSSNAGAGGDDEPAIKTKEEFMKADSATQLAFKSDYPEAYAKLWTKKK